MAKKIVIDTLGSDKGPETIILGISLVLKEFDDITVVAVGPEELIKSKLTELGCDLSRVEIINADETITNYENPMKGIMGKPQASLVQAFKTVGSSDEFIGMLTCGNSGAILVGSLRFLATPEMTRPCMGAVLPNAAGAFTLLVDTGATIDVTSHQLHEFAKLGRDFMGKLYNLPNPRIGLLSNGAEPTKGNHLVKETFPLLDADETLNFVGNIEGNRSLSGDCDVLVADGFAGNQVLKNTEGMAKNIITDIVKYAKKNNKPEFMEIVQYLMAKYDISSLGGAIVLGARKPVIKCRGNSDEKAILNTARILVRLDNGASFYDMK
ncbi:MAG: hypothetical protein MJ199_01960 [Bacilli bacterium]|nr:hypothetical protein [Bacilli bacterium]